MLRSEPTDPEPPSRPRLSSVVRTLGFVSLFADVCSEMVYPLNPVFITRVLGAPPWALGLIEGIAESTASLLKFYSGWLSDRVGRRKPLTVVGYALGALGKPLIALSTVWWHVLGARFVDRVGKGLRTAPRDALIAENTPPEQRGRAFGFHRSLDTVGAILGPLLGFFLLRYLISTPGGSDAGGATGYRILYGVAFLPGLISVLLLAAFVREKRPLSSAPGKASAGLPSLRSLTPSYRRYLLIVALFSAGNSSDTFLLLRAQQMGVGADRTLLLYALFNVVEAALGYSAGILSDRIPRKNMIAAGYGVFALVYLGFATLQGALVAWILFPIYGLYFTLTQGVQRALAADLAHPDRRATEIGVFPMVIGLLQLPASLVAGVLYSIWSSAPFYLGAVTAAVAALLLLGARIEKTS